MSWTGKERGIIKRRLLSWYDRENRDMPWRGCSDPYRILLSEFMLQQTQVDTVIPYFNRFIAAYPTIGDLARAELDEVLKLWEGLGYYSRARNLHKAAIVMSLEHAGAVPETYEALRHLPGLGPYTTAAVLSIAFGQPYAVLDGNVNRVLARIHAIREAVNRPTVKQMLQEAADELLNRRRPGDHNQAMMELGATVCKPRRPLCDRCPIRSHCRADALGLTESIPTKPKAKPRPVRYYVTGIIRKGDAYLIARRKAQGLLGGLWEFPAIQTEAGTHRNHVREKVIDAVGLVTDSHQPFRTVKHAYTHFSAVVHAYVCDWVSGDPSSEEHDRHVWVTRGEISDYAYSRIARKLVDALISDLDRNQTKLKLDKFQEN